MKTKNQTDGILAALKKGEKLTGISALTRFGCFRLPARIHELRSEGFKISSRRIKINGKHISQYFIK